MQIRFRGVGRRPALLVVVLAVAAMGLPGAAGAQQTKGSSFSYLSTDVSILGPSFTTSGGTIPAQSATLTDNVVVSGSITGNSYVTFTDTTNGYSWGQVQLVSSTSGSNTTACTTSNGGNKNGCYASITVTGDELAPGPNTIQAVFLGDSLVTGTTADFTLYGASQSNEKNCLSGTSCSFTESGTDNTSSTFSSPSGNSGELLSMVFGQESLPAGCPSVSNPPAGTAPDSMVYNITNAGQVNQFTYTVTDASSTADWATYLYGLYTSVPSNRVCFESSADFQAYSASGGTQNATQQVATDSMGNTFPLPEYAGEVANCVYTHKNSPPTFLPCLASATFKSASKTRPAAFTQVVDVPPNDSRFTY